MQDLVVLFKIVDGFKFRLHQLAGPPLSVFFGEELHIHSPLGLDTPMGHFEVRDDLDDSVVIRHWRSFFFCGLLDCFALSKLRRVDFDFTLESQLYRDHDCRQLRTTNKMYVFKLV